MPHRRFTIADVMILVPAMALGAFFLRSCLPGHTQQLAFIPTLIPDPWGVRRALSWASGPGSCFVVPVMAAMIVLRLRPPRPARIRSQPGFVACLAVMISLAPGLAWALTIMHRPGFQRPAGFQQLWSIATGSAQLAVVGGWLALVLAGEWDAEPSWIDRAGRALGGFWIALFVAANGHGWAEWLVGVLS